MTKGKIIIITAILLIGSWTYAFAQTEHNVLPAAISSANNNILADTVSHQVNEQILFRIGASGIDPSYMGNAQRFDVFIRTLKRVLADPDYIVSRIQVVGTASPDGQAFRNITLAGKRAESLAKYLQLHTTVSADIIEVVNGGENWAGLRMMIMESKSMPYREAMLELIDIADRDVRKHKMMFYADSKPWLWMLDNFFDSLRAGASSVSGDNQLDSTRIDNGVNTLCGSGVSMSYKLSPEAKQRTERGAQEQSEAKAQTAAPAAQQVAEVTTSIESKAFKPLIALKTDLMLWGGVMPDFNIGSWTPNLSAEIYFARRWSVQAGFAYSNWSALTGTKELYAVSVADMEMRHWFGKASQFKGFYLGVYGQYGEYDVQKGIQGQTCSFWSAGLGAGWMHPISRHWALEAEIRGGYRSAQNEIYDIEQAHYYYNNKNTDGKFTPQFRLQVVYRIGKTQKTQK